MTNALPPEIVLVVPCFNEEKRLDLKAFSNSLAANRNASILFVDDGSIDKTVERIEALKSEFPMQVDYISLPENMGKAEAVRAGINNALKSKTESIYFGYIDADLATSIEEAISLSGHLERSKHHQMVFGSRMLMVGTTIVRKMHRHYIGRVIATIISNILHLQVYDTQCGAKIFSRELANFVFAEPFISKWLFDVEIFARILCENEKYGEKIMAEVPLKRWIDKGESKVSVFYGIRMFYDLFRIARKYPLRAAKAKRS